MWRQAVKTSRCLIPAIGWYEWKPLQVVDPVTGEIKTTKQPYFLHLVGKPAFALAGLMSRYTVEGETRFSASIITREAEGPAADVHTRMPVILPHEAEGAWMDRELKDGARALAMAKAASVTGIEFYAVSSRVSNSPSSGAELIEPFPNPA